MINLQPDFLLINNKYNYGLKLSQNTNAYPTYGLITTSKPHTISFLFYTINHLVNHHHISCPILFTAYRATTLSKLIELHKSVVIHISPSHAFYIGIELMKAELSLIIDHDYIQS